ncbi:hypothetical protein Acr_24g0006910 [Actinidia rufa]|uniref:Tetratricopeptide repeat (TPR)-like superfamily protein n=1 Tax=Actinidia rufa TaxID=165716 RepID=A0A7J0GUT9_9ERIC|nr:hypothetical protein Acr_24g0006910 [Actinidia rufa]
MIDDEMMPDKYLVPTIFKACNAVRLLRSGKMVHGVCGEEGVWDRENENTALCNEMIAAYVDEGKMDASMKNYDLKPDEITYHTMLAGYARQGKKNDTHELLSEMTKIGLKPNIVSFNNLISGFQQYGLTYEALKLFRITQSPSNRCFCVVRPNPITVTGALAACADPSLLRQGKEIHRYLIKNNFESNIFVSSALVEHTEDALKLFNVLLAEGHIPSLITFMTLLPACSDMEAASVGRALHGYILKSPNIKLNNTLASALIEMYAKCDYTVDAKLVFDSDITEDTALRNAMTSDYSTYGMATNVVALFEQRETGNLLENYKPYSTSIDLYP